jgi:hypothetical protein
LATSALANCGSQSLKRSSYADPTALNALNRTNHTSENVYFLKALNAPLGGMHFANEN